jgi:hypothetical protein
MKRHCCFTLLLLLAGMATSLLGDQPPKSMHPTVQKVVADISDERIAAIMKKLESFGTRNTNALPTADPKKGIVAARQWILEEMKSYSPKLKVRFDSYRLKKSGRLVQDTDLVNVVAELPGTVSPDVLVAISGHYDSMAFVRLPGVQVGEDTPPPTGEAATRANEASAKADEAPGVSDDASGVAAVMELARVMSQHTFDKTVVFIAFAGEEQGLFGSSLHAAKAKREKTRLEALLNNDIIGNDVSGNGVTMSHSVRLFSGDPMDSGSRALARYVKEVAARYVPSMSVDLVFRQDRFGRGGDHTPFHLNGYAAVRFTTPAENLGIQHTAKDNFESASAPYTARVARVNGATLASLALAPKPPDVNRAAPQAGGGGTSTSSANLGRGRTRYDAVMRWRSVEPEPDLAGYAVVIRSTLAPLWEREIYVGKVDEFILKDFSIDDVVIGIKAYDKDGVESMVSAYPDPVRRFREPDQVGVKEKPAP